MFNLIYIISFSLLIAIGIGTVFLVIFPFYAYLFIVVLVYGLIDKFHHLQGWELMILGILCLIMLLIDYFSGLLGAQMAGASKKALLWGVIGLILGLIVYPPFGSLIGLFFGVLVSELLDYKKLKHALKSASGTLLGTVSGVLINFVITLVFLALFVIFAIK
jgi:uncharacterized protein